MPVFNTSYKIILPVQVGDFHAEWQECLQQMKSLEKDGQSRILKINVFLHSVDFKDFNEKKQVIEKDLTDTYKASCPTFGILPNSPEKSNIGIEIKLVDTADLRIYYRKYKSWRYTVIEKYNCKKIYANAIGEADYGSDTETAARNAFEIMHEILMAENLSFDHIVRQWNYIGNILFTSVGNNKLIQRYQAFNEVRHEYYSRYRSVQGYPAATGIGMNYDGVMIDFIALAPCKGMQIASVFNPVQVNPYSYEQKVLIGDPSSKQNQKRPPMFDRAKLICNHEKSVLFVSGTAAVIGQETVGQKDIRKQTEIIISNIKTLISPENLYKNCHLFKATDLLKYKLTRVYVKNQSDFELVKSVCVAHFGDIPAIYLQADICREELLVEIEAKLRS